ncbi:3-hydroxyacyl-CoA dehydrogenase [Sphingomonas sp. Leaf357]|uniref:SDR family NAD(P)-dependent oxidoreductase n=1 Tax=Sphingomonas sp. Leaf357 TaxID=1736350 RepID=UPI0006FBAAD8|nr:SDR family NAD(P)-dependent oxidoreductase [Sphingomonas sp. Leaf357]KQS03666.1 3-hydroxyacyl-CoA dehydrogenase [Sphingomonas sp. Leaf357]
MLLNKAIIVTGAGRGVGREIALAAAAAGACVVVNDLGVAPDGADAGDSPADDTVRAIRAAGGMAVANNDNVAHWASAQRIVGCAMDTFGRIDGVVNNAGILRDALFHKLDPADFDAVIDVNLRGPFYVSRAAAPHFKTQGSGAYLHMTSTSALIGNMGQANYIAAKLGVVGLSTAISLDMARFGVVSNCIAPFAWTRMVATIPTDTPAQQARVAGLRRMAADRIAPVAVALLSDGAREINGQVFGVRNNEIYLFGKNRPVRTMHDGDGWRAETVLDRAFRAMAPDMPPPVRSGEVFSWNPV